MSKIHSLKFALVSCLLLLRPQIRVAFDLDPLHLRRHEQWLFGIKVNGYEFQPRVFLPVLHAVLPHTGLRAVMKPLRVEGQHAEWRGPTAAAQCELTTMHEEDLIVIDVSVIP